MPTDFVRAADVWEQTQAERFAKAQQVLARSMRRPTIIDVRSGSEESFYRQLEEVRMSRLVLPALKQQEDEGASTWKRKKRNFRRH